MLLSRAAHNPTLLFPFQWVDVCPFIYQTWIFVLLFPLPKSISLNRKSILNKGELEYNSKLDLQSDLVRKRKSDS